MLRAFLTVGIGCLLLAAPLAAQYGTDPPAEGEGVQLSASGVDKLVIGGEARARGEYRDPYTPITGAGSESQGLLRVTAYVDAQIDSYVGGRIELRESVNAGGMPAADGLQQGYIELNDLLGSYGLQTGRFMQEYGSGRMVAHYDWLQAPYTYDGARVFGQTGPLYWDAFYTRTVVGQGSTNPTTTFMGLYGVWDLFEDFTVDTYALRQRDFANLSDIWTFGGRAYGDTVDGNLDWSAEFAGQAGDIGVLRAGGYALAVTLDYSLDGGHNVGVGWSTATGDRNNKDNEDERFRPVLYDGHKFNGLADIVVWSNLNDLVLKYWLDWNERWSVHADGHWMALFTGKDVIASGPGAPGLVGTGQDFLGAEIDVYLVGEITSNFRVQLGGSYFFAGNAINNNDDQIWGFLQAGLFF